MYIKILIYNLINSIYGESIKLKGLRLGLTAIITGIIAPIIIYIAHRGIDKDIPHNAFINFTEWSIEFFISYFLPLYIIYSSMVLTIIDHRKRGWQLMSTLPVHKYAIYTAKLFHITRTVLYTIISHMVMVIACVYILYITNKLPESASINFPLAFFINISIRILISSIYLITFQFLLSVFISKYLFPIFIGFVGFALHLILMESNIILSWYPFSPIAATYNYMNGSNIGNYLIYTEWISTVIGIILFIIGVNIFRYRSITLFIKQNRLKLYATIITMIILLVTTYNLITPNISAIHNRTILSGKTQNGSDVKNVYLINSIVNDTIAGIPIENNSFHSKINTRLKYGKYKVSFGKLYSKNIVFGNNDSLYINADTKSQKIIVTGTSMLETHYINNISMFSDRYSNLDYYLENSYIYNTPERFFNLLIEESTTNLKAIESYKSADNYTLSKRFKSLLRADINMKMLSYLNKYKKGWSSLNNNKTLKIPSYINILSKPVYNEMLLDSKTYLETITDLLKQNEHSTDDYIIEQSLILKDISFRDKLLYIQLSNTLNLLTNSNEINSLISKHLNKITNKRYRSRLQNQATAIKSVFKGQKAPDFNAVTTNNKTVSLADFKGKYLLIDVWTTWCRPCAKQSRFFNRMASKLKDLPIQFVALNINRDKKDWKLKTGYESIYVKHLYSINRDKFSSDYACKRIPRFILIDPDGYIVNSNMPKPSSKSFEEFLTNYIKDKI